jgi:hypothetical protein
MSPGTYRAIKVLGLCGMLWVLCLVPWPGPSWFEATKPAILAATFSVVSCRLRIDSWALTIAFSLTFFLYSVAELLVSAYYPSSNPSGSSSDAQSMMVYFGAMVLSPISLWAPVIFGTSTYAVMRRVGSNLRWSGDAATSSKPSE